MHHPGTNNKVYKKINDNFEFLDKITHVIASKYKVGICAMISRYKRFLFSIIMFIAFSPEKT